MMKVEGRKWVFFHRIFGRFLTFLLIMLLVGLLCGLRPYIVMSGSMEPAIATGALCVVNTKADYGKIMAGEIIAYRTATGMLVTHRVVSKTPKGFVTKGDANACTDGLAVTEENFSGKTICAIPGAGYVLKFLQQPVIFGSLSLVYAAACFIKKRIRSVTKDG